MGQVILALLICIEQELRKQIQDEKWLSLDVEFAKGEIMISLQYATEFTVVYLSENQIECWHLKLSPQG